MSESQAAADISGLSFEQALAELETIVRQLESGAVKLEDAISAYARGAGLQRHCESKLAEAKAKVEKIAIGADGVIRTETMNLD